MLSAFLLLYEEIQSIQQDSESNMQDIVLSDNEIQMLQALAQVASEIAVPVEDLLVGGVERHEPLGWRGFRRVVDLLGRRKGCRDRLELFEKLCVGNLALDVYHPLAAGPLAGGAPPGVSWARSGRSGPGMTNFARLSGGCGRRHTLPRVR